MIEVVLPNLERLDLYPTTSLSLKRNNPILAEGVFIPGEYSLPFEVPLTESNARNLSHPHLLDNTRSVRKIQDVRIYVDGIFYKKGTIYIGVANNQKKSIQIEFRFGLSAYADSIKTGTLPDIIDEDFVLTATVYQKTVYLQYNTTYPLTGDYSLVVNNNRYEAATLPALASAIDSGEQFVTASYSASGFPGGSGAYITLACAFSGFDTPLKVKPGNNQVWLQSSNIAAIQDPVFTAIEAYYDAEPPDDKIRFPMSVNLRYRKDYEDDHFINYNADGLLIRNTLDFFTPGNKNSIQPYVKLSHLLTSIATYLGLTLEGDFIATSYYDEALIDSTENLSFSADMAGDEKFLFTKKSFNLRDLVPNITISDFLKALQTRFNLGIYVNENAKTLRLQHRDPILVAKTFQDITALTYDIDNPEQKGVDGVALKSNQSSSDLLAPTDKYLFGSAEEITIETNCGSLHEETEEQTDLDMVHQDINSSPGLRLLFEGGTIADTNAIDRNIAVSAPAEGYLFADIYAARWKFWLNWYLTRRFIPGTIQMGMRELTKLNWESKFRIDGIDYILVSTEETITMEGIKPVRVALYKV